MPPQPPPQDPTAGRAGSKQGKGRKKKPPAASSSAASSASAPPNDPTGRSVIEPPAAVAPPLPPPSQSDTGGEVSARGGTHTSTGSEVSTPEVRKRKRNRGQGAKALPNQALQRDDQVPPRGHGEAEAAQADHALHEHHLELSRWPP